MNLQSFKFIFIDNAKPYYLCDGSIKMRTFKDKSIQEMVKWTNNKLKSYTKYKANKGEYIFNKNEAIELIKYLTALNSKQQIQYIRQLISGDKVDYSLEYEFYIEILCRVPSLKNSIINIDEVPLNE